MAEAQPQSQTVQSFETGLDELEKVVRELETGDLSLDRSLELFSRGMQLSEACRRQLEQAETRVEALVRKEGTYQTEPFRPAEPSRPAEPFRPEK